MKRLAILLLVALMITMVVFPVGLYAQETEPEVVAKDFVEAVNEGDTAGAAATTSPNVVVTAPAVTTEGEEGDPSAPVTFNGSAEAEAWLEAQSKFNANITLGACVVEGELVTCDAAYASDVITDLGINEVEGEIEVEVVEGKIQAFNFTPSAESAAELQAAAAAAPAEAAEAAAEQTTLPKTGGTNYMVLLALFLGLLLLGGLSATRAFQRSGARNQPDVSLFIHRQGRS